MKDKTTDLFNRLNSVQGSHELNNYIRSLSDDKVIPSFAGYITYLISPHPLTAQLSDATSTASLSISIASTFSAPSLSAIIARMPEPVPWLTSNVAICCYIVLFCWLCSLLRSRKSLIYYVPLIATMLIVMAAPANQGFPRYLFPVVYMAPLLFIDYLKESLTD